MAPSQLTRPALMSTRQFPTIPKTITVGYPHDSKLEKKSAQKEWKKKDHDDWEDILERADEIARIMYSLEGSTNFDGRVFRWYIQARLFVDPVRYSIESV